MIFLRFAYLQIYNHKKFEERAGANSIRKISLHAPRGIIYDRNGKPIAIQTCRPKSGPGGMIQDSMVWSKDYQICLAKQTKLQGYCG